MLVLKVAAVLAVIALAFVAYGAVHYAIREFDRSSAERHGYAFLTKAKMAYLVGVSGLLYGGYVWRMDALSSQGDEWNGTLLMLFGLFFLGSLTYTNIRRTSIRRGIAGTLLQWALLPVVLMLVQAGILVAIPCLLLAALASVRPVVVIG
jgi:hypothetical protein